MPGKLAVYIKLGDSMRFVGNKRESANRRISAHISSLGTFALVRDVKPPIIFSLSPGNGAHTSNTRPLLRSSFRDELSGISGEANRLLKLDGKKVIAVFDPEATSILYTPDEPLTKGEHSVEIWLRDQCGNIATKINTFFID